MKIIPYGIDSFSELRQHDYLYVDKTRLLYELVRHKIPYFLSRPRRFGKTLTVSSLKAILEGRRELFKGLWIDSSDYDWQPYPVIHLSLASLNTSSPEKVEEELLNEVKNIAAQKNITDIVASSSSQYFKFLIQKLFTREQARVAILIDEYDAPILRRIS
ncbi:MAG: AAA family ATPase, partial [Deltaproteobacteria bacterium]|nr:AAA family ATPase [Deltaproteobacteria bacterium]